MQTVTNELGVLLEGVMASILDKVELAARRASDNVGLHSDRATMSQFALEIMKIAKEVRDAST